MGFGGKEKILDLNKIKVSNELNYWVDYDRPSSHEEFLDKTPQFCEYLFKETQIINSTSKDYIADKVPKQKPQGNELHSKSLNFRIIFADRNP